MGANSSLPGRRRLWKEHPYEAHVPAEQPSPAQEARFPTAHADPRRPVHPVVPPQQRPRPPVGLTCCHANTGCTRGRGCARPSGTAAECGRARSWCTLCRIGPNRRPRWSPGRVWAGPSSGIAANARPATRSPGSGTGCCRVPTWCGRCPARRRMQTSNVTCGRRWAGCERVARTCPTAGTTGHRVDPVVPAVHLPHDWPELQIPPDLLGICGDQSADARAAEGFGLDCGTLGSMPPLATRRYQSTATCGEVALRR